MAQLINGPKRYKQFVKSSLFDVQDPVFLTFDLDFFPDLQSTSRTGGLMFDMLLRPTINGAYNETTKESSEANPWKNVEMSATDWLTRYSKERADRNAGNLLNAIKLLGQLQESPWYFQSIQGVDQLWKSAQRVKEGDRKVEITINCLDSIRQPLLRFAKAYRDAIYDKDRMCYTLPDNLRTFDMIITLFEIRDLNDRNSRLAENNDTKTGLYQVRFRLSHCEFDFADTLGGPTSGAEIKAYTEDKPFSTSFKIRAEWVTEEAEWAEDSNYASLGIFSGLANSLTGRAQRFLSSALSLPGRIIGDLTNQLQTGLENTVAENVYNRTTEVLGTNRIFGRNSPVGPSAASRLGDDVYPGSIKAAGGSDYDPKKESKPGDLGDVYP